MLRPTLFLASFIIVLIGGFFIVQYAKGLRFDAKSISFKQTGILVATSNPDGAQVFINGDLKGATNSNINLSPGNYDIQITKEGFYTWSKRMEIQAGVVAKTDAILLSKAASLSPLTFFGAEMPILSPDSTKLAWVVNQSPEAPEKIGVWIIDLGAIPFGFSREARQVTDAVPGNGGKIYWSPDSRNIILERTNGNFLLDPNQTTLQGKLVNLTAKKLSELKSEWQKQEERKQEARLGNVPDEVADIMVRKASSFSFSPDENRILYTAKDDGTIPENLIPPLPGASTQKEERAIKKDHTYIYDIKEDRNFLISTSTQDAIKWFPTSRHVVIGSQDKISVIEHDGTNNWIVWSGPYSAPNVFPAPQQDRLIILTNLGNTSGQTNLYSIGLR